MQMGIWGRSKGKQNCGGQAGPAFHLTRLSGCKPKTRRTVGESLPKQGQKSYCENQSYFNENGYKRISKGAESESAIKTTRLGLSALSLKNHKKV